MCSNREQSQSTDQCLKVIKNVKDGGLIEKTSSHFPDKEFNYQNFKISKFKISKFCRSFQIRFGQKVTFVRMEAYFKRSFE